MPNISGEIITLDELATHLKVGKRTVYRLAAARKIPAFKVGGAWRFSLPDIDRWIQQQSSLNEDAARPTKSGAGR